MKISIIIPTYNEEEYLPKLLESIKSQDFTDYEVIVADAQSNDNTREIAKEYGCVVVEGGLPGPEETEVQKSLKEKCYCF